MAAPEPGLDLHEWVSELESIEPDLRDSPAEALPELHALIERMLVERGFDVTDSVADDGDDPELLVEFRAARDTTRALERGDDVDPGDVAAAINGYRAVFDSIVVERRAP